MRILLATCTLIALQVASGQKCVVPGTLVCQSTATPPTLDADLSDWDSVTGIDTEIHDIFGVTYAGGSVSYKCLYDAENVYFALEIPGDYRFSTEDNKLCAAIGTMMKIGAKAAFINMGGCPDALPGCPGGVPPECEEYRVDLGAHWELRTTEQGVEYPMNITTGTGNDLIANNDDEYGVAPWCRFDDDDVAAGNEWAGAWAHSNPIEGSSGLYSFELARSLTTASLVTDAQLAAGETISFGIAYWDPFETENGWTNAGHFLTGCASSWIDLVLEADTPPEEKTIECLEPDELVCEGTSNPPTLDGELADWSSITGITTTAHSIFGTVYEKGQVTYKCVHDNERVYFSLEIPGEFRFSTEDNKLCSAIGTMMKIGSKAAFLNMGGCPDQASWEACDSTNIAACADYAVDLGAHWELKTTVQGVEYPLNASTGSGNDLIANNDDEYGVNPVCRPDDDDADAANDWAGAWSHSNPVDGGSGMYRFEIARTLSTVSMVTDTQMAVDQTYEFGIAFWDPFETDGGWTEAGHFLTGCSSDWISLSLGPNVPTAAPVTPEPTQPTTPEPTPEPPTPEPTPSGGVATRFAGTVFTSAMTLLCLVM